VFAFEQFGVVCPIAASKISQRMVMLRHKGPKFFVVSAIMNPTQHQKKREQFKLRAIIGEQCFDDGEFGLLLGMSDGARFGKVGLLPNTQGVKTGQVRGEFGFIHDGIRGHPRGYETRA